MKKVGPQELKKLRTQMPVFDVRTPAEYHKGHIPGAINLPLFSNEERAVIGTLYKQQGKETAVEKGLELVGPKLSALVAKAKAEAIDKRVALHCWRGGMRSSSVAWLFETAGLEATVLEGGYKAYRRMVLDSFENQKFRFVVLGGRTGSGKTMILHALRHLDQQVVDLEGLANHRGSAFGAIGQQPQPTTEHFENKLHDALSQLNPRQITWIENESRSIGRVYLPTGFWKQKIHAPLINIEIPSDERIKILLDMYDIAGKKEALREAFVRIRKRLGGQHVKAALEALDRDDLAAAARIALRYYDKTYQYGLETSQASRILHLRFDRFDPTAIARNLIQAAKTLPG